MRPKVVSPQYGSPAPADKKMDDNYITFGKHMIPTKDDPVTFRNPAIFKDNVDPLAFKNGTFNLSEIIKETNMQIKAKEEELERVSEEQS